MRRRGTDGAQKEKVKVSKTTINNAKKILRFMKPYQTKYYIGLVFLFFTGLTALAFPKLLGSLVDSANNEVMGGLGMSEVALLLLGLLILQSVFSFFRVYLFTDVTESTLMNIRQTVYAQLIKLPMSYFSEKSVGELNSRMAADISQLRETFRTTLAEFLRQFIIIVGGVAMLAFTSPRLTGLILIIVPVVALSAVFFGRYIRTISKKVQDDIADSNTIVMESLQGIANVKAFANEFFEINRYNRSTKEIRKEAIKGGLWSGSFVSFIILCLFGAIVGVIWYAMILVEHNDLTFGEMITFLLISVFIGASIGGIAELYTGILKAIGASERLMDILDQDVEKVDTNNAALKEQIKGELAFENVDFFYPSRAEVQVLKNISFSAAQGEQVAVVGPSGAGKSTITALLLRFYEPTSGQLLIDGKDAKNYGLTALRNQMAMVPQEVLLFGGTIRENIAYGKPGCSEDEIKAAADKANATEFIEQFPEGYDTMVGERGIQLSGGQRQRIAIARAILKDPAILILDEATSSLDSESERLVQDALDKLMEGRTTIVIAHRLSTIRNADKIIVLENGEVKETGTHQELQSDENGLYNYLSNLQLTGS